MTQDKEFATELFRNAVLHAMDEAARQIFAASVTRNDCGATDADLPRLFPAIDAQLEVLSARFNHHLYQNWIGTPKHLAERAFLQSIGETVAEDAAIATEA